MHGYADFATEFRSLARVGLLAGLWRRTARKAPRLEADSLPDYLRKDLGLADGRVAMPRDPLRD